MRFRPSPLVALNLLFIVLILAIGLPCLFADAVRLPSEITIREIETAQPVSADRDEAAMGRLRLASVASNAARADLALAMLAGATDPDTAEYRTAGDHASRKLRAYLAASPGDARAWANLALAERRRGTSGAAVAPFKMSIELAPYSAVDLAWRCGFGLDLYSALDEDGKAMLARQFRLAMDDALDTAISEAVARAVWAHNAIPLVWGFVADDPAAAQRFTSMLARIK
ncbi:MAG TPA: hypothetical protein VH722_21505 [Alphaproteobacteria bacterium]|jgi:hypothetical protein|nr:hypothetical protein [Alphaproteobacteria bacterium]